LHYKKTTVEEQVKERVCKSGEKLEYALTPRNEKDTRLFMHGANGFTEVSENLATRKERFR